MKKAISFSLLISMLAILCALGPGTMLAESDTRGVKLMFIVDFDSVDGCADGESFLDDVIMSALENKVNTAFFIDSDNIMHDADYASAMMKIYAGGFEMGIYGRSGLDVRRALTYQKYATKRVSRMLLCESEDTVDGADEFLIYTYDKIVTSGDDISEENLLKTDGAVAVKINKETAESAKELFSNIENSKIYLITPSETGYHIY